MLTEFHGRRLHPQFKNGARIMASARNEAPKAPMGVGCGEGVVLQLKMASFGAFWELILLQLNCLQSFRHKQLSLGFGL